MSKQENIQPGPDAKSLLVVPRLAVPYEGVTDEIGKEYISNPSAFVSKVKKTLLQENPLLRETLFCSAMISPLPEYSEKWALTYYEIFSRSGRKAGLPLACFVNEKLWKTSTREMMRTMVDGTSSLSKFVKRLDNKLENARLKDEEMSIELKKFWRSIDEDKEKLINEGRSELAVEDAKICLREFQLVLQENDNEYQLSEQYMHVDPLKGRI